MGEAKAAEERVNTVGGVVVHKVVDVTPEGDGFIVMETKSLGYVLYRIKRFFKKIMRKPNG